LEQLKFERERLAMKEEQFLRQVHKLESQTKSESKRLQERYESMMHTRQRENERTLQELEEKLSRSQDESDDYRKKSERLEKQVWELKH
jgi:tellurite resistance protein